MREIFDLHCLQHLRTHTKQKSADRSGSKPLKENFAITLKSLRLKTLIKQKPSLYMMERQLQASNWENPTRLWSKICIDFGERFSGAHYNLVL